MVREKAKVINDMHDRMEIWARRRADGLLEVAQGLSLIGRPAPRQREFPPR